MDRLTIRNSDGSWSMSSSRWAEALERLAAYEDTGLEPEMCAEYKKFEDEVVSKGVTFKRIVELMEAEKDGRLVVLHTFSAAKKKTNIAQWAILATVGEANVTFIRAGCSSRLTKWFCNYGIIWLAYRYKPKDAT